MAKKSKAIRVKFSAQSVAHQTDNDEKVEEHVMLVPVVSGDPHSENTALWAGTPNGRLELVVDNPDAWGFFQQGGEYFIDFTPA